MPGPGLPADLERAARTLAAQCPPLRPRHGAGSLHPALARTERRDDQEFWQFRDYTPGDDPRRIDWRRSGSSDNVLVRERQRHDPLGLQLWLDGGPNMQFSSTAHTPTKYQSGQIIARALDLILDSAGGQLTRIEPQMALRTDLPALLLSDFWAETEPLAHRLDPLIRAARPFVLLQIADRAELDLPYHGRHRFHHAGQASPLIESVDDIRALYQERLAAHLNALTRLAQTYGGALLRHRQGDDLAPALTRALASIGWLP